MNSEPAPEQQVDAILAKLRPRLAAIQGAIVFPYNLPPILGLGSTGGFQYVLEALQGQSPTDLAAVTRALTVAANQQPELAGVFTTFAADTPQIYLDIDRDKAQVLGVKVSDVFNALQATLGSFYVNDFNLFGRTWQVNVESEDRFRAHRRHLPHLCPQRHGHMVPIRALARPLVQGPQSSSATTVPGSVINGGPRPASVPARHWRPWKGSRPPPCRPATASNGRAPPCRRRLAAGQTGIVLGLACCSPISSWWGSTRAGTFPSPCCCRFSSACWELCCPRLAGLAFDSMRRSAWSSWSRSPPRTAS